MPLSTFLAGKLLDHAFRPGAPYTPPTTVYVQADTTLYAEDGTGGVALTGTGAARQAVTNGASSSRQIGNSVLVNFSADAPADWAGQVLKAFSYWDALTSGNLLWTELLTAQLVIAQHSQAQFTIGQLVLILDA